MRRILGALDPNAARMIVNENAQDFQIEGGSYAAYQ